MQNIEAIGRELYEWSRTHPHADGEAQLEHLLNAHPGLSRDEMKAVWRACGDLFMQTADALDQLYREISAAGGAGTA